MAELDYVSDYEEVTGKFRAETKVVAAPVIEVVAPVTVAEVK